MIASWAGRVRYVPILSLAPSATEAKQIGGSGVAQHFTCMMPGALRNSLMRGHAGMNFSLYVHKVKQPVSVDSLCALSAA